MQAMCINVPARTRVNVVMPKQRHSLRIINDEFNFTSFEKCKLFFWWLFLLLTLFLKNNSSIWNNVEISWVMIIFSGVFLVARSKAETFLKLIY